MNHVVGAILAGGGARRFGSDKALASWRGKPLIDHAAEALRNHCDSIVIVGRERSGYDSIPDLPRPGEGPLGGMAGALAHAAAIGARSVLTAPCDVPAPPPDLFAALAEPSCWCEDHPVFAHWSCTVADRLFDWMTFREERAIRAFATEAGIRSVRAPGPIHDIDTPDDLARL